MVWVFLGWKCPWILVPQSGTDSWLEGFPQTAHYMDVELLKTVSVCLLDRKWSMCVVSKILLKMNGLECVWKEIVNA